MFGETIPVMDYAAALHLSSALSATLFGPTALALRATLVAASVTMGVVVLRLASHARNGHRRAGGAPKQRRVAPRPAPADLILQPVAAHGAPC